MKKHIVVLLFACCLQIHAQEPSSNPFIAPFDFPLFLSGNFGELRSNHFHGGIDLKTENVEGKKVCSLADGYISRLTVSAGGYGNALYINHPNGLTTVYGHLKEFIPALETEVEKYQYTNETFETDLRFDSVRFPVKKGDLVALSGNSGYSFGPHLHLEIRYTQTDERIDPLQFYLKKIKDQIPPRATGIMIYPQRDKGVVNGRQEKQLFPVLGSRKKNCIVQPIEAWGEIGVGIKAFDYMNNTSNNYGVRSVTLYVDSTEVFNSSIDSFLPCENRMINTWTDFEEYKNRNSWVMKSFITPGNRFRGLTADTRRGIVTINRERNYVLKYVLKDLHGNTSEYNFTVRGKRQPIERKQVNRRHFLHWNKTNVVQEPGMELIIPKGMLYEDVALNSKVINDSSEISFDYQIHDAPVSLHGECKLAIGVRNISVKDTTKYYVARKSGKAKYYAGGTFNKGWMIASIRELGTYGIAIDTIPPKVIPVGKNAWRRSGNIVYTVSDRQTGIKSYKGKIDGKFVLFTFNLKTSRLTCKLNPKFIQKGMKHTIELAVTDQCGNSTIIKELLFW